MKYTLIQTSRILDISYWYLRKLCNEWLIKRTEFEFMWSHKYLIDQSEIIKVKNVLNHKLGKNETIKRKYL